MALADDDESVPGASLPSLVDDTLLLIATYLPACRDVLSLSILRVSPDGDGTAHDDAVCRELERRDRHREARSRRRAAPTGEPTFGVCEAVFEVLQVDTTGQDPDRAAASTTCLRGDDAAKWPEEHLTYRPDEECYHNPPMFLVGNCAVVYSGPTTRPAIRRTKFTVWRF